MESPPSSATLRKFFFSYTLHLTSIIIFPLLVGLIILFLSYYYASHFFLKATLLELVGENAEIEYIFAIFLGVVSLISVVFIISLLLSSFYYARNAFFTHANFSLATQYTKTHSLNMVKIRQVVLRVTQ